MQAIKCDRCGEYYEENRNFAKSAIFFANGNGATQGEKIDLCDDCMDELDVWLRRCIKER